MLLKCKFCVATSYVLVETDVSCLSSPFGLLVNICSYEKRLLSTDPSAPPLSLKECEEMMTDLKNKYPEEYIIYNLSSVAVAMVFPLVKEFLQVYCSLINIVFHLVR